MLLASYQQAAPYVVKGILHQRDRENEIFHIWDNLSKPRLNWNWKIKENKMQKYQDATTTQSMTFYTTAKK